MGKIVLGTDLNEKRYKKKNFRERDEKCSGKMRTFVLSLSVLGFIVTQVDLLQLRNPLFEMT